MRRLDNPNNNHVIHRSGVNTPVSERHEVYDAYHDDSYILSHDCRKVVSLTDKGEDRVYRLINDVKRELVVMRVDGGIFNDSSNSKCDFGIYTQDRMLILVELKGAGYSHAVDQIDKTINEMIAKQRLHLGKLHARVVLSKTRVPNTLTSKEMALKRKLMPYGGTLAKGTRLIEERLSNL